MHFPTRAIAPALALLWSASAIDAQESRPTPIAPTTIESLARDSSDLVRVETIGTSRGARPIRLLTLANGPPESFGSRPGILVVAGADGTRPIDTALALDGCRRLVDGAAVAGSTEAALLDECVVYVVPSLNPDGIALRRHGNAAQLDIDRDGAHDEDAADDIDDDGVITSMRWPAADGEWILDPEDPQLTRKANRDDGERGTHRYAIEAVDTDGDGERTEDDGQGVWIDRSFSHRHDEFDRRTGPFPMSEPETRALADFVFAHRNIVLAFVWGRDDNLLATPKVKKPAARVQNDGILEGDKGLYEKAGELYRERTEREGESSLRMDGSPWSWLYFQVGVPTFASDIWRPAKLEEEEKKDPLARERRRLAACEAAGRGFEPWKPFEHPELGSIEVGGFVHEDVTHLLPDDERDGVFAAHHDFFLEACAWRPSLRIESLRAEPLGSGNVYKIEAQIVNDGALAALTATGERTRRFSVPRLVLDPGSATVIAGRDRERVRNLEPFGGREQFSWILSGTPGDKVGLRLIVDPVGDRASEVQL